MIILDPVVHNFIKVPSTLILDRDDQNMFQTLTSIPTRHHITSQAKTPHDPFTHS